ncbi:MAG: ABC transporter ATP-binding protein [Syntrophales bacterium]|nr:ABC transporter ATP-binding protein [Syntrophales bacterium]
MLLLKNINTFYGNIRALKNISLKVNEGEIVTLIGANGAGKSTTLLSICGLVPPKSGDIVFQGRSLVGLKPHEIVFLGISLVPEGRRIFPRLSVKENLEMGAFLRKNKHLIKKDMEHIFELFPILAERKNQTAGTLSGGEQQMLAISRALMAKPKLLLLDEPSLGLSPIYVRTIFEIIERINKDGTTIFLVEQNANMALKLAHRGYVMETGQITIEGPASELMNDDRVKSAYLGL